MKSPGLIGFLGLVTAAMSCTGDPGVWLLNENDQVVSSEFRLLARFVHVSDTQIIDEESPARFAPVDALAKVAWRPHEAYSSQLFDGINRAINRQHETNGLIDFVVHTGDATDNTQANEWRWFLDVLAGREVDPLSGVDDRLDDDLPPPHLDPHMPFIPAGLYRQGTHGSLPSIPWYAVIGNHDRFAVGTLPIFDFGPEFRVAPFPIPNYYLSLFLPPMLNPEGRWGYGLVTPACPGPPSLISLGQLVQANPDRRYLSTSEVIRLHFDTDTLPLGHGFVSPDSEQSWYSVSPVDGLRLIVLDSALPRQVIPTLPYVGGTILAEQVEFLERELLRAYQDDELVILCSHHPSQDWQPGPGTAIDGEQLREMLMSFPNVVLHLAGHLHRNRVIDRGGYLEIETCSVIDYPQQGRVIEIWQNEDSGDVELRYWMFSHLPDDPDDRDELYELRRHAFQLAKEDAGLE